MKDKTKAEIMAMSWDEINKLSTKELQHYTRTLNLVANKRRKNLIERAKTKSDINVSAITYKDEHGDLIFIKKFETGRKNTRQEILSKFKTVRDFLNLQASTVKRAKEIFITSSDKMNPELLDYLKADTLRKQQLRANKFWDMFHETLAYSGIIRKTLDSRETYDQLLNITQEVKFNPNNYTKYLETVNDKLDKYLMKETEEKRKAQEAANKIQSEKIDDIINKAVDSVTGLINFDTLIDAFKGDKHD